MVGRTREEASATYGLLLNREVFFGANMFVKVRRLQSMSLSNLELRCFSKVKVIHFRGILTEEASRVIAIVRVCPSG